MKYLSTMCSPAALVCFRGLGCGREGSPGFKAGRACCLSLSMSCSSPGTPVWTNSSHGVPPDCSCRLITWLLTGTREFLKFTTPLVKPNPPPHSAAFTPSAIPTCTHKHSPPPACLLCVQQSCDCLCEEPIGCGSCSQR